MIIAHNKNYIELIIFYELYTVIIGSDLALKERERVTISKLNGLFICELFIENNISNCDRRCKWN